MTRSIFDPEGRETEHSGSNFNGPDADNISHIPADVVDGQVSEQEQRDAELSQGANAAKLSPEERIALIPQEPVRED